MRQLLIFLLCITTCALVGNCGQDNNKPPADAAQIDDGTRKDQSGVETTNEAPSPQDQTRDKAASDLPSTDQTAPDSPLPSDKPTPADQNPDIQTDQNPDTTTFEKSSADTTPDISPDVTPVKDTSPDQVPPNNNVPVFVAQGDIGRTMLSCDDGKTWRANRSWELEGDAAVCGKKAKTECYNLPCQYDNKGQCATKTPCDCDHHPGAPQGMAFGAGWFVGTWGWGPPGSVRRSQDGVKWETVIKGTAFGGIDFGNGTFVTGDRSPQVSGDAGKTWQPGGKADLKSSEGTIYNVRTFAYANVGQPPGRFIMTGESGTKQDILVSADKGNTWVRPTKFDRKCASGVMGIASGKGVIVIISRNKIVCRSVDAGKTFTLATLAEAPQTKPLWDGKAFHFWVRGKRYSSTDGKQWAATKTNIAGSTSALSIGAVERSTKTGTYVAVLGGWKNWYSKQALYRSLDGITWTALTKGSFVASHRIRHIRFGYVNRSAQGCP